MGISSAMNAGVMGLSVNSSKLAAISDNIANSETKGYKRSDVEFNSLVLSERPTSYDAGGVRAATLRNVDEQGALVSTRNALDLAISGKGFLPVTDAADVRRGESTLSLKLIRTGSFRPDETGILKTNGGLALLAWPIRADGTFSTVQSDLAAIRMDGLSLAAEATTRIEARMNLSADVAPYPDPNSVFVAPMPYFDPLGRSAFIDLRYTKTADNVWTLQVFKQPYDPMADAALAAFRIEFETNPLVGRPGAIRAVTEAGPTALAGGFPYDFGLPDTPPTPTTWIVDQPTNPKNGFLTITPPGAGAIDIRLGALNDANGLSQLSAPSQVLSATKDGSPASALAGVEIDETGLVDAIYDSGFRQTLYKVPVANVQNPNGMRALDGQAFQLTRDSGAVFFYEAGTGPTGPLVSSALEESTTDVAEELTQLIKTQRAYSSNAKIIQTVDEMLQETTNLKR